MSTPSKAASKQKVRIRMYRPGLGDCFLLSFGNGKAAHHLLIDCGVLQNTDGQEERLEKIVKDILKETGGKLSALVATHEHADHLSGFGFQKDRFKNEFEISQVWMGWTENKADPEVKETFRQYWKITTETLDIAIQELQKKGKDYAQYEQVMEFLKPGAMDVVKEWGKEQLYLAPEPGADGPEKIVELQDLPNVRFHVLAPPKELAALKRGDPPKSKHQLDQGEPLNQSTALTTAIYQLGLQNKTLPASQVVLSDLEELIKASLPFDSARGISLEAAVEDEFFKDHYGIEGDLARDWQRIDTDWLESIGSLALDLDSDINNTSLVLAIELLPSEKVLLFCGDAQYGNWKSWTDTPKGKDLLKRTIFYKVGHHGSHNATQLEGGLLEMTSSDLVAMIPVDREKAQKRDWEMPALLLERLLKGQTKGRLISAFGERPAGEQRPILPFQKPVIPEDGSIPKPVWGQFIKKVKADLSEDALWVDYTLTA